MGGADPCYAFSINGDSTLIHNNLAFNTWGGIIISGGGGDDEDRKLILIPNFRPSCSFTETALKPPQPVPNERPSAIY